MSPDGSMKPLPEERLLKLIRGKGPKSATASIAGAAEILGSVPRGVRAAEAAREPGPWRWPILATWVLAALLMVEIVYLGVVLLRPAPVIQAPLVDLSDTASTVAPPPLELPSLAQSASPALFAAATPLAGSSNERPRGGMSDAVKKLSARLTLMGIMEGEPPQAIIEDTETRKTYFVSPGQPIAEGALLEEVLDNRVILDLNGEKIELSL